MGQILRPKTERPKSEQFDNQTIMVCQKSERVGISDVDCIGDLLSDTINSMVSCAIHERPLKYTIF